MLSLCNGHKWLIYSYISNLGVYLQFDPTSVPVQKGLVQQDHSVPSQHDAVRLLFPDNHPHHS